MEEHADKQGTCRDCKRVFVFTPAEQAAFAAAGRHHTPSRCPECRATRARTKSDMTAARELHPVFCAKCGARTRVPFVPRTQKPVYCRACFIEMRGGALPASRTR